MSEPTLQFLSDERGDVTAVVVPIEVWREITSELETRYLLQSAAMKKRLLAARERSGGYALEEVLQRLDVSREELDEPAG